MRLRIQMICLAGLICWASGAVAQCTLDLDAGKLANETIAVHLPAEGEPCEIQLAYEGEIVSPRQWYYCVAGNMQAGSPNFRSSGPVQSLEVLEDTPERAGVRITSFTDDPDEPDRGTFTLDYTIQRGSPAIRHEMTFTPKRPEAMRSYSYFVATRQAAGDTHRLHSITEGALESVPARTSQAYGRISFPTDPAFVALEDTRDPLTLAVGAPETDVNDYQYSIEFQRFELSRTGGYIAPNAPLHDFALLAMGPDAQKLADLHREFVESVERPEREAEPDLPPPDLRVEAERKLRVNTDPATGALERIVTDGAGDVLDRPGGLVFVEWPEKRRITPADGEITDVDSPGNPLIATWEGAGLEVLHTQNDLDDPLQWSAEVRNDTDRQRLLEVRVELPLAIREGYFFDGMRLMRFDEDSPDHEMTTLVPGARLSQGIFPAVCAHDGRSGIAVGMPPMHIESFYGARLERSEDGTPTLSYVMRWALPPGGTRTARFVLYAIDPQWSWRSMVARYWKAWPEVFAAPERDDVWGLYAAASPPTILRQGDRFIERCRRLRIGGMELYAPFAKTGDFYPDEPPIYRNDEVQTREEMKRVEEIANIASCNISYVIPTKCEREMAQKQHRDSIIRLADGSLFMLDRWCVMQGEKLAGMFAWGNSYGERLKREVHDIVDNYQPDGFYFDNGAFVWQDYGRQTPWTAFDDEGRVYTNGGIPYAMIQEDLMEYAPEIHRNPGEFIQYFSGFRGQSHLSNIVRSQRHYVRSHRLIMGYKPIFPGHPRRIGSKQQMYDYLELGGLPWVVGTRTSGEALAQAWAPIATELARAGWHPVTNAVADSPDVRVERFGDGPMLFTVRNTSDAPVTTTLTIRGGRPHCSARYPHRELEAQVHDGLTSVTVEVPPREMEFVAALADTELQAIGATLEMEALNLIEDAPPTSIVIPKDATDAQERMARRLQGFVLMQADVLEKEPVVEIVRGEDNATHEDRVIIEHGRKGITHVDHVAFDTPDEHTTVMRFDDEAEALHQLSAILDQIAIPMSDEPAKWLP